HSHSSHLEIARRFLCCGWNTINAAEIQQSDIENEYLVSSEKKNTDLSYIVNVEIWTCTCFVGLSGAP
ncbi:6280_t:CDS:1, partial [Dentiscutata erythropus]